MRDWLHHVSQLETAPPTGKTLNFLCRCKVNNILYIYYCRLLVTLNNLIIDLLLIESVFPFISYRIDLVKAIRHHGKIFLCFYFENNYNNTYLQNHF